MSQTFAQRYGPWALVTGASSGIGREFARQLAARGLNVALVARRAARLDELAAELVAAHRVEARPIPVDLCADSFLDPIRAATAGLEIGLLVNSAGFSLTGPFLDMKPDDLTRLLNLNSRAPALLAREFGPAMRARRRGGIIFLSSVTGFAGTPLWSLYAATKAFNLLLGEALAAELRADGVAVMALAPGTTRTEFLDVAGISDFMGMEVEAVVAHALSRLGLSDVVVPGLVYSAGVFAMRFLPRAVNRAVFGRIIAGMRRA
ncbi:SDR family NAD(P)-dependent oxidoreductase [Candidatus Promineifilum breve]|uniref:SDR family NAD(P)-dependent oxidoreductase n=1 Tax=Candidatus Promineifilum breve TaxID=1806508 RepID=UPI0012FF72E0|nr:SDR family NAD(P)-dependent oxidoreductase [Candidatus Promineifilum breve]